MRLQISHQHLDTSLADSTPVFRHNLEGHPVDTRQGRAFVKEREIVIIAGKLEIIVLGLTWRQNRARNKRADHSDPNEGEQRPLSMLVMYELSFFMRRFLRRGTIEELVLVEGRLVIMRARVIRWKSPMGSSAHLWQILLCHILAFDERGCHHNFHSSEDWSRHREEQGVHDTTYAELRRTDTKRAFAAASI